MTIGQNMGTEGDLVEVDIIPSNSSERDLHSLLNSKRTSYGKISAFSILVDDHFLIVLFSPAIISNVRGSLPKARSHPKRESLNVV